MKCACGCGQETLWWRGKQNRYLLGHSGGALSGEKHPGWKGGRLVMLNGVVLIYQPNHHRADCKGYVQEHILSAEKALGHPICMPAVVHHIDGNRGNNSPYNLIVFADTAMHTSFHRRQKLAQNS
jgi:hypothetical protein